MFSWFKKKKSEEIYEDEDIQSYITYSMASNGTIFIDVKLNDTKEETVDNLAQLLSDIYSFKLHLNTLEVVKNGFSDINKDKLFESLLEKMIHISREDIASAQHALEKKSEDDPCVSPSDMV